MNILLRGFSPAPVRVSLTSKKPRSFLRRALRLLAALFVPLFALPSLAAERVTVVYPGPLNISYLPLDLAVKIGADKAEGIELVLRHVGGGGIALQQLQLRNTDFAVAGVPAALSARQRGQDVVVVAPVNDLPLFLLMVRGDLRGKVKRPRDLAGGVIGVNASSLQAKTTSQQLAELILRNDGASAQETRFVAAGQSWDEQSSALRSRAVDAILGDEPFASRLAATGEAFVLVNLADPKDAKSIPGAGFLHAALETRSDIVRNAPQRVEKMVAMLRRTLQWMAAHSPEQIVAALAIDDPQARASLLAVLQRYPRLYSPDAKFSQAQIVETDRFFAATEGDRQTVRFAEILDDRWAGKKP